VWGVGYVLAFAGIILLFVTFPGSSTSKSNPIYTALGVFSPVPAVLILVVAYVLAKYSQRLAPSPEPPELTTEERAYLKLYPAIEKMDYFQRQKVEVARTEAVKVVTKVAKSFNRWNIGDLSITMTTLGSPLSTLRKNVNERLVPGLKSEVEKVVSDSVRALMQFGGYLIEPSLDSLSRLNQALLELPPAAVVPLPRKSRMGQHLTAFVGVLAAWAVVFLAGLRLGASVDVAYASATGFAGVIMGAYLVYIWRGAKETL
jgi:hypothetical protein